MKKLKEKMNRELVSWGASLHSYVPNLWSMKKRRKGEDRKIF